MKQVHTLHPSANRHFDKRMNVPSNWFKPNPFTEDPKAVNAIQYSKDKKQGGLLKPLIQALTFLPMLMKRRKTL